MIVKHIVVTLRPGKREEILRGQRQWNEAMARQAGFLGIEVASDPSDPDRVWLFARFESRAALDAFMKGEHDAIADATALQDTYTALDIRAAARP